MFHNSSIEMNLIILSRMKHLELVLVFHEMKNYGIIIIPMSHVFPWIFIFIVWRNFYVSLFDKIFCSYNYFRDEALKLWNLILLDLIKHFPKCLFYSTYSSLIWFPKTARDSEYFMLYLTPDMKHETWETHAWHMWVISDLWWNILAPNNNYPPALKLEISFKNSTELQLLLSCSSWSWNYSNTELHEVQ